jgi:hypothetical protein
MSASSDKKRFKEHAKKREAGGYVPLPHAVLRSREYGDLSAYAVKLLNDLLSQYRGDNNGDLCAAFELMRHRGWRSKETLFNARAELLNEGWVTVTRQGGRNKIPSLYAVTFYSIDFCKGKLDVKPTGSPPGGWRKPLEREDPQPREKLKPPAPPQTAPASPIANAAIEERPKGVVIMYKPRKKSLVREPYLSTGFRYGRRTYEATA